MKMADSCHSPRLRNAPVALAIAAIPAVEKSEISLHRRMTAESPEPTDGAPHSNWRNA